MIADSRAMVSLELVEINPVIDLHNTTRCSEWSWFSPGWARKSCEQRRNNVGHENRKGSRAMSLGKKLRVGVLFGGRSANTRCRSLRPLR